MVLVLSYTGVFVSVLAFSFLPHLFLYSFCSSLPSCWNASHSTRFWDYRGPQLSSPGTGSFFWLGKLHGQRSLAGCSPWGCKESDMTEWMIMAEEDYPHKHVKCFRNFEKICEILCVHREGSGWFWGRSPHGRENTFTGSQKVIACLAGRLLREMDISGNSSIMSQDCKWNRLACLQTWV